MKKKSSHLKNLKQILKQEEQINSMGSGWNRQRIELPRIEVSTFQTLTAKKTLIAAVTKIEEYIQISQNQVPSITNECLNALKLQLKKYPTYPSLGVRKTEANEASSFKENDWTTQSQVFNVNISRMRKVASKDLFEKVSTVKYSVGEMINVREQEVISALKDKLKEKDLTIKKLHNHIEELQGDINTLKKDIQTSQTLNTTLLQSKEKLEKELIEYQYENQSKSEAKWQLTQTISKMEEVNLELKQKYKILLQQLIEKEAQIIAVWRLPIHQGSF